MMNIVVRGANWIGDAVMTLPALAALRREYPGARITLHTRSWAEGVFRDSKLIDEILLIERESIWHQAAQLRERQFDLAVLFPNSFRSALVAKLARIPRRLGYDTEKRGMLLTSVVAVPEWKSTRHESGYYLNLLGHNADAPATLLEVSDTRTNAAAEFLATFGIDDLRPVIGIGAGSTNSQAKRWPAERFAELAEMFTRDLAADVLLLGAANEADVAQRVASLAGVRVFDLCGRTDLAEATAILSRCDLFVSNDMGLAHIAAATETPTIVIFGPTNELTTHPIGPHVAIMREHVECSPCMLRECPIDHRCMTRISPSRVFETARGMLETHS